MRDILILTESELRSSVAIDDTAINVVEAAFRALAEGGVVMPPILSMDIEAANAEVDVKTAYIPGFDSFAIKVSPGFFNNPQIGLPSLNGLMVLFSATTGLVEAVFLDNGYLTDVRTAAAGAVAANHLAAKEIGSAGVLGTGIQARLQMIAAHQVRPYTHALVWGRDPEKSAICAANIATATGAHVEAVSSAEDVVRRCSLVVTTTPSREPLVHANWLHPGLHITAMGSDQEGKTEIAPEVLVSADLYVCDRVSQCAALGELRGAHDRKLLKDVTPPELGQIIIGEHIGRTSPDQVTLCDLTGTGVQDTAIATHARKAALAARAGSVIQV